LAVSITASLFTGNSMVASWSVSGTCSAGGGALYLDSAATLACTLSGSTLSGNSADVSHRNCGMGPNIEGAGALLAVSRNANATLTATGGALSGNAASGDATVSASHISIGGGAVLLYSLSGAASTMFNSSLLANNAVSGASVNVTQHVVFVGGGAVLCVGRQSTFLSIEASLVSGNSVWCPNVTTDLVVASSANLGGGGICIRDIFFVFSLFVFCWHCFLHSSVQCWRRFRRVCRV
jgi:hypothetical protein